MTTTAEIGDIWYSYQCTLSGYVDLATWKVIKVTPKGVWLKEDCGAFFGIGQIWVSFTAKKRRAYPDKDEAWTSFRRRAERALMWEKLRLHRRQAVLAHIQQANVEQRRTGMVLGYNPPSFHRHEYD